MKFLRVIIVISLACVNLVLSSRELFSDETSFESSEEFLFEKNDKEEVNVLNIMADILRIRIDDIGIDIFHQIPPPSPETTTLKITPQIMETVEKLRAFSRNKNKFMDDLTNPRLMEQNIE